MSVSRVMMGAHFLGDITVGALVGLVVGYACAWLCRKVTEKL
jgi:membrane-associated phospholipid phosphatase